MLKVILFLVVLFFNADIALAFEFRFNKKTYQGWKISNYNEELNFEIRKGDEKFPEYLRITLRKPAPYNLAKNKRIDTAFKLTSPLIKVVPDKAYCIKAKLRASFDIPYSKVNRGYNYIIWYNMYNEEIGNTSLNGIGKKTDSFYYFVDTGLLALPEAEKARIVLGFDWPDFSEKDSLDIYEVKFEEYQNKPFDFDVDGDLGWEITFNHQNHLVMGIAKNGANGSRHCYRVERNRKGKADTAFKLSSPYIPVKPDSYYILSFEERHNYDFSRVTKGYCQILWYDVKRNLIGKSEMGSLMGPHLDWFPWMKPFFMSPKSAGLARVEFGNDWPDFRFGDFWEVDEVWLRPQ